MSDPDIFFDDPATEALAEVDDIAFWMTASPDLFPVEIDIEPVAVKPARKKRAVEEGLFAT